MAKVLGLGGVFFKSDDPEKLGEWYKKWLGIPVDFPYGAIFKPEGLPGGAYNVWSPFKRSTKYMEPSEKEFMFNFIVDDLSGTLEKAGEGGGIVLGTEESEYGKFGWFIDPEDNKVELWEPPSIV